MSRVVLSSTGWGSENDFTVRFQKGELVFAEGDTGTEMYIVREGKVEILKTRGSARQQLAVLEQGDFFGEMSLLTGLPRSASARALTDVVLVEVGHTTFDQLLRANTEIAVRMMRKLCRRLQQTDELLRERGEGAAADDGAGASPADGEGSSAGDARLVHERTGIEFRLPSPGSAAIGRRDPSTGVHPVIDLSEVDAERSSSRRHATIHRQGSRYFLTEEIGTTNGTYLNGARLRTGVPVEIESGDRIRMGLVLLTFQAP